MIDLLNINQCKKDEYTFGNVCEENPDFIFNIDLYGTNKFDNMYYKQYHYDEDFDIYEKNILQYMYDLLYNCDVTKEEDRDCNEAWEHGIKEYITITEDLLKKTDEYERLYKPQLAIYGYYMEDNERDVYTKNKKAFNVCMNEYIKEKKYCVDNIKQGIEITQDGSPIYRKLCFENDEKRKQFIQQIKDHDGKSIQNGSLSDLGLYWSWDDKPAGPWGKGNKCVIIEAEIRDPMQIDINNTYAINMSFNCSEKEIRLLPGSDVIINSIIKK